MSHRIREAMRGGDFAPFGSGGGIVESSPEASRAAFVVAKGMCGPSGLKAWRD